MCELRCCPISTRTTSAGCRSSNAARGTDLALGASATLPRRGFRWRRPNSLRHHGRAGGSTAVAPGSYPPSAGGGGPSPWSVPTAGHRSRTSQASVAPLAVPGASPVARRPGGGGRTASRIDQHGACRQGGFRR
jgi:hypothetical protein